MTSEELEAFKNMEIKDIDKNSLTDIKNIRIDPSQNKETRITNFIKQAGNPYFFRNGDLIVKCSFTSDGSTIGEHIENYLKRFLQK
jgi:hypothetical protein